MASRKGFSYSNFKHNQFMGSIKYKATKEFNIKFNKMLSDTYDSYIDFTFEVYDILSNLGDTENEICNEVNSTVKRLASSLCRNNVIDYIENEFTLEDSKCAVEFCNKLLDIGLSSYLEVFSDYCTSLCTSFLEGVINNNISKLTKEDCFKDLVVLDTKFVNASFGRLHSLFDKIKGCSEYLNEMFNEECGFNLALSLKDDIISCISSALKEVIKDDLGGLSIEEIFNRLALTEISENVSDIVSDKDRLDYIDDYKRLNKLATDSGFEYVRSKGDHGIFKNDNGLIVVIPQGRSIGKGLSIKIQKAINSLSSVS